MASEKWETISPTTMCGPSEGHHVDTRAKIRNQSWPPSAALCLGKNVPLTGRLLSADEGSTTSIPHDSACVKAGGIIPSSAWSGKGRGRPAREFGPRQYRRPPHRGTRDAASVEIIDSASIPA